MAEDWKDILGALRHDPSLPAGDASEEVKNNAPVKKDTLKIIIDKKGRKGKIATIIEGFTVADDELASIAAMIKKKLGVGGSSRGGEILIQGNFEQQVRKILQEEGFKVK